MARRAVTTIQTDGPFFRKDPVKTFRQNVRVMMDAIAAEGELDVKAQLMAGMAGRAPIARLRPDHVSQHVIGRTKAVNGKRWAVTAVVSANRPGLSRAQSISLRAAASSVESRVHAFRKTKNRIWRAKSRNMDELLKGIA